MSKRALYIAEREGKETYEDEKGFVEFLYEPREETMWITDMYVLPEFRDNKIARFYYNKVEERAKEIECPTLSAGIDKRTIGWKKIKSILEYDGFKKYVYLENNNYIVYKKEINYGI